MAIGVGDQAPDFELPSSQGGTVRLQDLRGQPVVVFFYPRDDTPGCTTEACHFRDNLTHFQTLGATVLGVSGDDLESHERFAAKHNLPFPLLADTGNGVRKRFGVPSAMFLPGRVTYVIDREGVVRLVFNALLNARAHVQQARTCLEQLAR
ncbi:MAG: alkyl hydroperoxide reductase [Candidatus Synechococcus spongiarum 15L]|uniref:thioredoxin-dependent peroxiredoxin n=1 Tax=Candidatus Synechococcus spongiarum 15L TaxID=1608419 RepID=A0A0G8AWF4_9SYNE|nr:MAG: alkyl hydroperoxide reductase [Candidatus Synechococcus spongiarum 15L]